MLWRLENRFYTGIITGFKASSFSHLVKYDDHDEEELQLWSPCEQVQLLQDDSSDTGNGSASEGEESGNGSASEGEDSGNGVVDGVDVSKDDGEKENGRLQFRSKKKRSKRRRSAPVRLTEEWTKVMECRQLGSGSKEKEVVEQ